VRLCLLTRGGEPTANSKSNRREARARDNHGELGQENWHQEGWFKRIKVRFTFMPFPLFFVAGGSVVFLLVATVPCRRRGSDRSIASRRGRDRGKEGGRGQRVPQGTCGADGQEGAAQCGVCRGEHCVQCLCGLAMHRRSSGPPTAI
jgi:hypothetical protein